jgi:tetratricopeptide (TPR) repeat protein
MSNNDLYHLGCEKIYVLPNNNNGNAKQDIPTGIRYLENSAEKDKNVNAMEELAIIYRYGIFVEKNYENSSKYFKMALDYYENDANNIHKYFNIGNLHYKFKNITEAIKSFEKGVENKDSYSMCMLAELNAIIQNYETCIELFKMAANEGNDYAKFELITISSNIYVKNWFKPNNILTNVDIKKIVVEFENKLREEKIKKDEINKMNDTAGILAFYLRAFREVKSDNSIEISHFYPLSDRDQKIIKKEIFDIKEENRSFIFEIINGNDSSILTDRISIYKNERVNILSWSKYYNCKPYEMLLKSVKLH